MFSALALMIHGSSAFMAPFVNGLKRSIKMRSSTSVQMKVNILQQVETLKVLTAVSKAGLLSKVEKAGLLSKLEKEVSNSVFSTTSITKNMLQGALSKIEKLLPLLDDYRAISLLTKIVNIEPITFTLAAAGILFADGVMVAAVPDSSNGLVLLQVVLTVLALTASAPLFVGAQLNSIIQGDTPIGSSTVSRPGPGVPPGLPLQAQAPPFYSILDQLNSLG